MEGGDLASLTGTIEGLSRFWSERGCLRLPPAEFEMPAAVMHPETFFRLLAPEPWRAQVVQPVRRPLDARHGRHPFRLARHLQLAVTWKEPPADLAELVVGSLAALGLQPARHDVRWHDWSWESRALGSWAVGWTVRLDGVGVARASYHQQMAGRAVEPVAGEVVYGVERLTMVLAGLASVFAVPFVDGGDGAGDAASYGRLRGQSEGELSRYGAEVADAKYLFRVLDGLEEESERCRDRGLPRVAYELAVKCLWRIDLLTARGELSSRERDHHLERVRHLVAAAAESWLASEPPPAAAPAKPKPAPRKRRKREASRA